MTPMAAAVEDFLIRPIRKGDVKEEESVVSLVNRCYRGTECWTTEADIVSGLRLTHEQLQASIRDFHVYVMVDTSNENIVGCVKSGVTTEPAAGSLKEPAGYMGLFAVSPDYQSRRLGSRLADFAEQKCKESGVRTMTLDVLDVREDIMRWYERRGFRRTGLSADATSVLEEKGEKLLRPASFTLMAKEL